MDLCLRVVTGRNDIFLGKDGHCLKDLWNQINGLGSSQTSAFEDTAFTVGQMISPSLINVEHAGLPRPFRGL